MLRLGFYGAAGEVTGSCYLVTTDRARVLVDFGVFQGYPLANHKNAELPPISPATLDAAVLTHAHLDHIGRMPLLPINSYGGRIYATAASIEVGAIILRDAAHLQEADAERENRRRIVNGHPPVQPLYKADDVERALRLFTPVAMETPVEVAPGISLRFLEAGHILGAAEVLLTITHGPGQGQTHTIMFSGDIGPVGSPIIRDPTPARQADFALLESTYGDREHRSLEETKAEFLELLEGAIKARARILIPSFALGRTQDLLYHIGEFKRAGRLAGLKVVVDSPMANEISAVYRRHVDLYDCETRHLIHDGVRPLDFPDLRFTRTREESMALNHSTEPIVIMAASGMCTGGRIVHHLRHHLPKPDTCVIIVGFQSQGTLGRQLVDGAKHVNILGDPIDVRAHVHTLGGFSAHAGQRGLAEWTRPLKGSVKRLFLTHGEDNARTALRQLVWPIAGVTPEMPHFGEIIQLA